MTTSLRDLIDAVAATGSTVPPEVAAFVTLEVAERISDRPTRVAPVYVEVSGEGEVTVASTSSVSVPDAVRALGRLLSEMVAGQGGTVPPGLEEVVRRTMNGGADAYVDFVALRRDLEAYLVPLNRGAAKRVLARYLRDILREPSGAVMLDRPGDDRVDTTQDGMELEIVGGDSAPKSKDALDDLLEDLMPPSEAQTVVTAPLSVSPHERETVPIDQVRETAPVPDVGSILDELDLSPPVPSRARDPRDLPSHAVVAPPVAPFAVTERVVEVLPTIAHAPAMPSTPIAPISVPPPTSGSSSPPLVLADISEARQRRGFGLLIVTVVLLLGALFAVLYQARPELFGGTPATAAARQGAPRSAEPATRVEYGTLSVTSDPVGAEVLLFVGRGPVEVTHLPVGVAHEFVAVADDGRVARGLVPADAQFAPRRDGPDPVSTELAIQLPGAAASPTAAWPGTNLPPGAPPEGTGQLGTVRVVTNPLGAKVFLLVGFTPTAPISNLRLDDAYELLVVKDGHGRERLVIGRSDWQKAEGTDDYSHSASVTLRAEEQPQEDRPRRRRRRHR